MKRIVTEHETATGWTRWVQPVKRNYLMACCDCGLVHWMDFRIENGRVQFRARRAVGYTRKQQTRIKRKAKAK